MSAPPHTSTRKRSAQKGTMTAHDPLPRRFASPTILSARAALVVMLAGATACSDAAPSSAPEPGEPVAQVAQASSGTLSWKGYEWNVTNGGMAGIANGDPNNVSVDASGYLHLKITKNGTTWTAAELYSATNLGFGTYQWQVSGPIDRMDHTVVLGLSPYGPAAGVGTDGFNEIDTEFSYWNDEIGKVNMDWGVYPADSKAQHEEDDFFFSLSGGTQTTTRMVWSSTKIVSTVMSGLVPIGSTQNELNTQSYEPPNAADAIPQQPIPVLLNLWLYEAAPSSGNDVEVVLQDFQFVPEGQPLPDAGPPDDSQDAGDSDAASMKPGKNDAGTGSDTDAGTPTSNDAGLVPGADAGNAGTGADSDAGAVSGGEDDAGAPVHDGGSSGSGGGCSVGSGGALSDGTVLPAIALFGALSLKRRRRRSPRRTQ